MILTITSVTNIDVDKMPKDLQEHVLENKKDIIETLLHYDLDQDMMYQDLYVHNSALISQKLP